MGILQKFRQGGRAAHKEEILEHLVDFLNTRKEMGSYPKDYGLDTYIHAGTSPQVVSRITEDITNGIKKFDQRIHAVDIYPLVSDDCFQLKFSIICQIDDLEYSFQLAFHRQQNSFTVEVAA